MVIVSSISNFFITKTARANIWMSFSSSNSALEGPEIDGQTKMANNGYYSTGVFTVTFNSRCPSVFGLLITFVIEMGMALQHASWPFTSFGSII